MTEGISIRDAILKSGIFDAAFYKRYYSDSPSDYLAAFEHFLREGIVQDRWPNFYFDPVWYKETYAQKLGGQIALGHFLNKGDAAGLNPGRYFDTQHYRKTVPIRLSQTPTRYSGVVPVT